MVNASERPMQEISRRQFVQTGLITGGALAAGLGWNAQRRTVRGSIRLLPVEGVAYSKSFTRFMTRARFDSVRDAVASIRDRTIPVHIAHITYAIEL